MFGLLSDKALMDAIATGDLLIDPFDHERIQPASIDLTLDWRFQVPLRGHGHPGFIDPKVNQSDHYELVVLENDQPYVLHPGDYVLGCSVENVTLPIDMAAQVEGKSSLARLGLLVHITAGFIDPGFNGQITLEFANIAARPILLWPFMPVAQLAVTRMEEPALRPYGERGKYQNQVGPQLSRYHLNQFSTG